ncbi:hypothetical protein HJG39_17705 [Alteromonas sp. a30]|nr:hypothetical protein [Alteromonas sp. a30]
MKGKNIDEEKPALHHLLADNVQQLKIYDTQNDAFISIEVWLERTNHVQYLLIGEVHNQASHPEQLLTIISLLNARTKQETQTGQHTQAITKIPIVLEMLEENDLGEQRLVRGWDSAIYNPLFTNLKQQAQLISGALTPKQRNQLFNKQTLAKNAQTKLDSKAPILATLEDIPKSVYRAIDQDIIVQHGSHPIDSQLARQMTNVQLGKDAKMAHLLQQASSQNTLAILYAGIYHVRKDRGVPLHLFKRSIMTVIFQNANKHHASYKALRKMQDYTFEQADYVMYLVQ